MPRLLLFVPCQIGLVDASTNVLSLIGLVEALNMPSFPAIMPEVSLVAAWRRTEDEAGLAMMQKIDLVNPDGEVAFTVETPFIFERLGNRVINRVLGIPLTGPGQYEMRLFVKPQAALNYPEQPTASYPILIQNAPSAQLNLGLRPQGT